MTTANSKEEFDKAAEGLPTLAQIDLSAEVVCIEPLTSAYFHRKASRQRCIVRLNGRLYLSEYE